jgi:transcriptional regulator with XRE-family HTH domain
MKYKRKKKEKIMSNKLLKYLTEMGIGHNFFARKVGSSHAAMNRILRSGQIPSLKIAIAIEQATNSAVRVYDWILKEVTNSTQTKKTKKKKKNQIND